MSDGHSERYRADVLAALIVNVVSSTGVIFANKALVFAQGFPYGCALTIVHFIITFLGIFSLSLFGVFDRKFVPIRKVLPICFAFCGYVVFNNLSLLENSVAFYQMTKILCTPVIIGIQYFAHGKSETREVLISLAPVCLGILITVYADTSITPIGVFWALAAVVSNATYTVWGKTKQDELGLNPYQILLYQAPVSALILLGTLFVPALQLDSIYDVVAARYTTRLVCGILLSACLALGVNLSFFMFVGKTTPLSMNVVGYLKTVLVFVIGFTLLNDEMSLQRIIGVVTTMVGLAMYSKVRDADAYACGHYIHVDIIGYMIYMILRYIPPPSICIHHFIHHPPTAGEAPQAATASACCGVRMRCTSRRYAMYAHALLHPRIPPRVHARGNITDGRNVRTSLTWCPCMYVCTYMQLCVCVHVHPLVARAVSALRPTVLSPFPRPHPSLSLPPQCLSLRTASADTAAVPFDGRVDPTTLRDSKISLEIADTPADVGCPCVLCERVTIRPQRPRIYIYVHAIYHRRPNSSQRRNLYHFGEGMATSRHLYL